MNDTLELKRRTGRRAGSWRGQRSGLILRIFLGLALATVSASGCMSSGAKRQPMADKKNVSATSGLASCSTRLSLAMAPQLVPGMQGPRDVKAAFGAERLIGVEENVEIRQAQDGSSALLRVRYPKDSINFGSAKKGRPLGGAAFYTPFATGDVLCLHYKVRFPGDFDFVKGGKLPGLYGGEAPSGGDEVTGTNGWSVRLMWRKDGAGELYEYIVNKDEEFGLSAGRGAFQFPRGRWVEVDLEIKLNDPGRQNGIARLWIDGKPAIEQRDLVYTTGGSAASNGGLMFSTFFGGSDDSWASPKDQHVDFADFRMYRGESQK
jgi:hypothetical protein